MGHKERAHAVLSASGAHRWLACTPSARLEEQFPDTISEAASEGTLAHELAEAKLRHYFQTADFDRQKYAQTVNRLKEAEAWQEEMQKHTDAYLDFVKTEALRYESEPAVLIEERVGFGKYTHREPGNTVEGTGTADCILIGGGTIHVIDFKYGKGVPVTAELNPQMMLYALGAYESFGMLYPIERVALSIFQPRIGEGVSSWQTSLDELLAFGKYAKERAETAWVGGGSFKPDEKTCRFCRARSQCRARAEKNVQLAFFTDKKPPLITNREVGDFLARGADVAAWLKDLQEYALSQCLAGEDVPGWKAVEGRSSRDWTDMDAAFKALEAGGIDTALLWERKPLTLAQVEKVTGKKDFAELAGQYVARKQGKPALVKASDKRPPVTNNRITAKEVFKEERQQ